MRLKQGSCSGSDRKVNQMPRLKISEQRVGDVTVLTLTGRLVLGEGDIPLREHINTLIQEGRVDLVLNLRHVSCIDSSGVGIVVAKYLGLRRRGGDLKLVGLSRRCRRVFEITGLLSVFKPFESEEAAIRSVAVEHEVVV